MSNVRGRDLGGFVADVRSKIARNVTSPPGYFIEYGGQFENQERATRRLVLIVPVAIALIFVLLYLTFSSFKQALLVGEHPFALVGGIAALWTRGMNFNLSASIGFIALFGVAMLNGVVLVSSINQMRKAGLPLHEAVVGGARRRLRPVLMTAFVASFGFIPMAAFDVHWRRNSEAACQCSHRRSSHVHDADAVLVAGTLRMGQPPAGRVRWS